MLGGYLPWRLLRNSSLCIRIAVIKLNGNSCSHGFGGEYRWICPSSSIFAIEFEPWEQFRNMGGGPRTFPGGLNKWQWKRFHEKKAREKEKKLLQQERQIYEARIRSSLRGQLLETNNHFNNDNNNKGDENNAVEQGSSSFGPMTPKDQVIALANRFMKAGAEDLWNEDDGPLTTDPKPSLSLGQSNGTVTGFNEGQDSLGNGKMYRRTPIKDSLRRHGSSSFSRNFWGGPIRRRGSGRIGRYSDDEEMVQKPSRFEPVGRDSDEEDFRPKHGKSDRVQRWSDDEDEGQKHARRSSAPPKSLVEDEMELGSLIDAEMESGIRFEDDLLRSDRTGRRDFDEDDEEEFRKAKSGGRRRESISLNSGLRSKRQSLRNLDDEDDETDFSWPKRGGMGSSTSKYVGSRTRRQSTKDFDEGDETEFRWPKSTERGEYIWNHSGLSSRRQLSRNSNGDNDGRESRHPKLKRTGHPMSNYSGLRSRIQSLKESDEEDETEFRWPNPRGMGASVPKYSGLRSKRQSLRDLDEDDKTEFRQPECEAGLLRYSSRSKRRGPRDIEDDKDEEESDLDLDRQSPSLEVLKKVDQLKKDSTEKESLQSQKSQDNKEKEESYLSQTRFDQCSISPLTLQALSSAGYVQMTVVQKATLPVILEGKDVLAKAKTGTGKTVAFLLPAIEVVVKLHSASEDLRQSPIFVLVVCPTRELASQSAAEANALLKYHTNIGVQVVTGGTRLHSEQTRLQTEPCQILVATPGRLLDHIENTPGFSNRLMGLKVLILDEADHLLDMGFRKDLEKIIDSVPRQRQSLLFSATIPQEVRQISQIALRRDHAFINTIGEGTHETHSKVLQTYIVSSHENHFNILYGVLKEHISQVSDYKVLVFCTTGMVTRIVYEVLLKLDLNVREIDSRKPQVYRTRISDEFKNSKALILVSSDVSSRGIDYPDVTLVVQMGIPSDREQYIHRLGRTGRKGKAGQGLLLLAPWEEYFLADVQDLPIKKAMLPRMDLDICSRVQVALSQIDSSTKEAAYQAWLGYYNSVKAIGRDKTRLLELANQFSCCMGLEQPPALLKSTVAKMGLKYIPGLRIKKFK